MKKIALLLLVIFCMPVSNASKLSHHIHKMHEKERRRDEDLRRQDMNFADFTFRSDRNYINDRNENCRDYSFRSRSNPYKRGFYTVCDER